jgi:hypothetical protein
MVNDLCICFFDVLARPRSDRVSEASVLINGYWSFVRFNDAFRDAGLEIVFSEAWSAVDNTSTGVYRDEVSANDVETALWSVLFVEEWEQGFILGAY